LFHDCVERVASRALNAQKVPVAIGALGFAIIAHDIDNSLQVGGHWVFRNVSRSCLPSGCHALLADHSLFANGTAIIKARKLSKAVRMNGMSARKVLRGLPAREHVFTANWTIVLVLVSKALVRVKDAHRNAHAAF
jgi:hypothetical protein